MKKERLLELAGIEEVHTPLGDAALDRASQPQYLHWARKGLEDALKKLEMKQYDSAKYILRQALLRSGGIQKSSSGTFGL